MKRIVPAILVSIYLPCGAATVYKSVDENGQVTFSDQPPTPGKPVETLDYTTTVPVSAEEARARLERMRASTDRMAADRREREAARASPQPTAPPQPTGASLPTYYPIYVGGTHRPGFRPLHYPPVHPAHPPLHPTVPLRPSAATLPYPSSYIRRRYPGAAGEIFNPPPRQENRRTARGR
jgi:hypothetical protein